MSRVKVPQSISNTEDFENLKRFTAQTIAEIVIAINGNLSFVENIKSKIMDVTFSGANADLQIMHNLGSIPIGYILIASDRACIIYSGSQASTDKLIFLKSNAASAVTKILIF